MTRRQMGQVRPADLARVLVGAMPEPERTMLARYLSRHAAELDGVRHVIKAGLERLHALEFV